MEPQHPERFEQWIGRLKQAATRVSRPLTFIDVCGSHAAVFRSGLHARMPANVNLLAGPGCAVCVAPQGEIDQVIELAFRRDVTLCVYEELLRLPGSTCSLEQARRENGADVRVVDSSLEAVTLAAQQPRRQVVFAVAGFETSAPATAAAVLEARKLRLLNFTTLAWHKRIFPAMVALLEGRQGRTDGFLCPGHVAVIIGAMAFWRIVKRFGIPCAIIGHDDEQVAQGVTVLSELAADGEAKLLNLCPQAVTPWGNRLAMNLLRSVFLPCDAQWRGLGAVPRSGYVLRSGFRQFDARHRFALKYQHRADPRGCRCGDVITARCRPSDCKLFARACTPEAPVGPSMASPAGACRAYFDSRPPASPASPSRAGANGRH